MEKYNITVKSKMGETNISCGVDSHATKHECPISLDNSGTEYKVTVYPISGEAIYGELATTTLKIKFDATNDNFIISSTTIGMAPIESSSRPVSLHDYSYRTILIWMMLNLYLAFRGNNYLL